MNIESYRIYRIHPEGKTDAAWRAFQDKDEIHRNAVSSLLKELGAETCATDRGGIAGVRFSGEVDEITWRRVPGSSLWMPRAKTNRALFDRFKEEKYETNGWWVFQDLLGCDSFLCIGLTAMWPVVKDGFLLLPDCTEWEPQDAERVTLAEYYTEKGK